jgi:hypothetical protein
MVLSMTLFAIGFLVVGYVVGRFHELNNSILNEKKVRKQIEA